MGGGLLGTARGERGTWVAVRRGRNVPWVGREEALKGTKARRVGLPTEEPQFEGQCLQPKMLASRVCVLLTVSYVLCLLNKPGDLTLIWSGSLFVQSPARCGIRCFCIAGLL